MSKDNSSSGGIGFGVIILVVLSYILAMVIKEL